jgi:hypothetical protein
VRGVNGFVLTMLLLHLFETKRANKHMSSYQLFRMVVELLAHSEWEAKGAAMQSDVLPSDTHPPVCYCLGESFSSLVASGKWRSFGQSLSTEQWFGGEMFDEDYFLNHSNFYVFTQPSLETFHSHFDVVLLDHSGRLNLLGECPLSAYQEVCSSK